MSVKKEFIKVIQKTLKKFGYEIAPYQSKNEKDQQYAFIEYLHKNNENYSQIYQDLFVQFILKNKRNGFFVEFGATDGITLSNTYHLEKNLQWNGILAEPARCWKEKLARNRKCAIDFRCVWSKTGEIFQFNEVSDAAELSTLQNFAHLSNESQASKNIYNVETVSLNDLLKQHNAPQNIDYLSIDTEGSEYEILQSLDFDYWNISIITAEHNYTPARSKIHKLLTSKGYVQKLKMLSRWDDWYVKQGI